MSTTGPTDPITLEKVYDYLRIIEGRIDALERKQYDTAPSWASSMLDEMRSGFARVDKDMGLLRREMKNLLGEISKLGAGHEDLEERMERVENKH